MTLRRDEIGHHERGARDPGGAAHRAEVGHHRHVAVAALPAGEGVAVDGVEVDVDGQQVVAALRVPVHGVFEKEPRRDALAHEAALHISEGDDDGVDLARGDGLSQLVRCQISAREGHLGLLSVACVFERDCNPLWQIYPTIKAHLCAGVIDINIC